MRLRLGVFLSLLHFSFIYATLPPISVNPTTNQLVDNLGRSRLFHGVNVIAKSPPYYPTDLLSPERIQLLSSLGFNAVRLGTMWIGAEPSPGQYNFTYLHEIEKLVIELESNGIYSLLDSHQDLYSPKYCGDGAPLWAAIPSNTSKPFAEPLFGAYTFDNQTGLPNGCGQHSWSSYYLTEACASTFQSLYDNYASLSDYYQGFWKTVANIFKNYSSVIGYELINEPFPGNFYEKPTLLLPGVGDRENLQPFYNTLNTQIREVDDQHIIFFEPITWDITPVGFDQVPGGANYQNRSVLSWHYYCWTFDSDMNPIRWGVCEVEKEDMFILRSRDISRLGGGGFLTEFGLCSGANNASKYECTTVMDKADQYLQSWTYWDYSDGAFYDSNGQPLQYLMEEFSRTYARAVSGTILSMSYSRLTSIFRLEFSAINLPNNPPTEIYYNQDLHYPNGIIVTITPLGSCSTSNTQQNLLEISLSGVADGTTISVTIVPK